MKKLFIFLLLVPFFAQAQKVVEVTESSSKINGDRYAGYRTKITGNAKELESFLKKDLKSMGKTRERSSFFSITEMTLEDKFYQERYFYAQLNRGDETHTFWIGADTTNLASYDYKLLSKALEDYTYQFAIRFYKWEVQQEIDESLKAEAFTLKQKTKLEKETEDLANDLSDNEKELIRLQKAIEDNKIEHQELLKKIEENKASKVTNTEDLRKIRDVINIQRQKKSAIK